ncbi:tetratricopeptide repeat protein [Aestuariivivens sediminicola]|uniref:tetratricopeptide repeat protein n=1 Tax=Aestuariivivens sediminicola TaxID=2913560 RepID=UPI001F571687|nr:hypothetical protein [Aestuariivivens sediminicola]
MKHFLLFLLLFPILAFSQSEIAEAERLFQEKNYVEMEQLMLEFLEDHPENLRAIELLGDAYAYQKKWDEAKIRFKKLLEVDDKNANYHYKYGGMLGMKALENKFNALGLIGDVKSSFKMAADLDPNHIEVRWALVELYMQLPGLFGGSKTKSLHYAEELENLSKVDGYLAKGYIYEYDNEPDRAETYYKMAINEGGSLTCFEKLTQFYENENEPEKAIHNIEVAQQKYQRNALHYQIGKIAAEYNVALEKGEQCLNTYLKNYTVKDGVPKAWAHYRLAQIHMHKNHKRKALEHIDMAIAELPKIKTFKEQKEKIVNM